MQHDPLGYLWEVREAADAILGFIDNIDFHTYAATPLIHSAVERKFEIIGEALNLLSKTSPALAARVPEIAKIIAFRNLLIHGYAAVEHARVWAIAMESLPNLRTAVDAVLKEQGG